MSIVNLHFAFLLLSQLFFGSVIFASDSTVSWYNNQTTPHVVVLHEDSFVNSLLVNDGIWMVQFYSPKSKSCKKVVSDYSKVAEVMRGVFHVAVVDVTTEGGSRLMGMLHGDDKEHHEKNKNHVPAFFFFAHDKTRPQKYLGGLDVKAMTQALVNVLAETVRARAHGTGPTKVVQVTFSNHADQVLNNPQVVGIAFIAPWCAHCQNLMPEWDTAASKLHGEGAVLAVVDATVEVELATLYEIKSYPTIKIFPGGVPKQASDAKNYTASRTASEIVKHVLDEVDRTGVPKEIPELTNSTVLDDHCLGQNRLCVLAVLPHILDSGADGRNKYRNLLTQVSKTFRGSAFSFLWLEGGSQPTLEETLEMTFGFPAVVALSVEKKAYAVLRGSFTEKSITSFLHGITTGRQPTIKLENLPNVVTVDPWDGNDGVAVEEEMSLSDIMGWDDDDNDEKKGKTEEL